ncbi:hypothetical protein QC764_0082360 [Podospora pseudoanserina]|uniref:Uncharacterized protein n=1 Tax=Podospora pseudoanserina TaxID=2609844 RepID=A0ABR0I671_9PEZI|nr:hypothetical protein QC764_0082360 [Podospora pseudoanserina]
MPICRITVGSGANGLTLFPAGVRRYGTNDFLPRRPHRDQGLKGFKGYLNSNTNLGNRKITKETGKRHPILTKTQQRRR